MSEKIIARIKAGEFDRKKLENLYSNAERLGKTSVLEAAKSALKEIDTRSYSKRFIKPIKDKVKSILEEIVNENSWGKWEGNNVGNGIKAGGRMLDGQVLAQFYVSYRHPTWKRATYFVVTQKDEQSAVEYRVDKHDGGENSFETSEKAVELFNEVLKSNT